MNEVDRKLHAAIHQSMMNTAPDKIFSPRVGVFDYVEQKLGFRVGGKVLDIGCGSGYAAIWLAKNKPIDRVYALEASEAAVKELLPRNVSHHGVSAKVEPLLGSFYAIPVDGLDYVVSFGALHHSPCLFSTMQSIGKSLQNGGWLIAQEPVMPNTTTNGAYIDKYDVVEERFGLKIRNGERQDCFFREAEYVTAAAFSGLDLVLYEDYATIFGFAERGKHWLKSKIRPLIRKSPKLTPDMQRMAAHTKFVTPKIMVFRKSETAYVPHLWEPLKQAVK